MTARAPQIVEHRFRRTTIKGKPALKCTRCIAWTYRFDLIQVSPWDNVKQCGGSQMSLFASAEIIGDTA